MIENRLRSLGLSPTSHEFPVPPSHNLMRAGIGILAVTGTALVYFSPFIGAIVLVLSGWFHWRGSHGYRTPLSALPGRVESRNITAEIPAGESASRILVLVANSEFPESWADSESSFITLTRAQWSRVLLILICLAVPLAWLGSRWGNHLWYQIIGGVLLLLFLVYSLMPFIESAGRDSPDVVLRSTGDAAVLLELAAQLLKEPLIHTDIILLFAGGNNRDLAGSRQFLSRHEENLVPDSTWIINLEQAGSGEFRYCIGEGCISFWWYDHQITAIAKEVMVQHGFNGSGYGYREKLLATLPFVQQGYRCLTFAGMTPEKNALYSGGTVQGDNAKDQGLYSRLQVIRQVMEQLDNHG